MKKNTIYEITTCALFAALMCIIGPRSVPIGPVPISFTLLVIYLAVYLLGARGGIISTVIYLLLGAVGLPVFSNYSGGLAKLVGPTGGYLIGFIFSAAIAGIVLELSKANVWITAAGMVLGTLVAYVFGTAWFMVLTKRTLADALTLCVTPFIPFDIAKIVIASVIGYFVRRALLKAGLLPETTLIVRKEKKSQ